MVSRRRQAGFTLIELMVVVTAVALVMAAAGPAFGNAFADRRSANGAQDVLRIGRQAYWETIGYRRAHVVHLANMDGETGGRVELIRGTTNSCNQNWNALRALADCGDPDSRCIDWVDLDDSEYVSGGRGPWLRGTASQTVICYQPDGTVRHGANLSAALSSQNMTANGGGTLGGGYVFTVQTYDAEGAAEGVARSLLFPLGGVPRRLR
jgi:prepilin-type N-terminal cleavage/methylation domain-containing protein